MCESLEHGGPGEPSSTGTSQHDQSDRYSTQTSNDTFLNETGDGKPIAVDEKLASSPSTSSVGSGESRQTVDLLAYQLRKQSLKQPNGSVAAPETETVMSPPSLPDDDILRFLSDQDDTAMEVDTEETFWTQPTTKSTRTRNRPVKRMTSENILTMIASRSQCTVRPPSFPIAADPNPTPLCPSPERRKSPIEVDEGCDEDRDDLSWLEFCASLKTAGAPSGISKQVGLRYKSSADIASRCNNLVHSIPRMRRRKQKKRLDADHAGQSVRDN